MKIKVNGEEKLFDEANLTILDVLQKEQVEQPDMVSVQKNGEFVVKDAYVSTSLVDGDEIEFLYFMGGGSKCKNTVYL